MKENKNLWPGLDVFKFVAAILVLMLHANPFEDTSVPGLFVREVLTPIAVPFFFAASGFLFYMSMRTGGREKGRRTITHALKLYGIWSLVYLPYTVISWLINGGSMLQHGMTYIKRVIFEGSYETIWFLNALWVALLLVYILLRYLSPRAVFLISVPFYCVGVLLSAWRELLLKLPLGRQLSEVYYSFFETTKNGLLFGFVYVALGVLIAWRYGEREVAVGKKSLPLWTALAVAAFLVEYAVREHWFAGGTSADFAFSLVGIAEVLLSIAIGIKWEAKERFVRMRNYSTLVFLTQRLFLTAFTWFDAATDSLWGIRLLKTIPFVHLVLVAGATFTLSSLILWTAKRIRWVRSIY